ncbi:MAG: hypothetical protein KBF66_14200 [Rhodoferax sp.]|uniref:HdeA/HdeB family chaperone n=1 Tax=Rhodoferax sp. TaxID=50421 RepID=UPI001B40A006|nr:HdeA/HdeB family chaperone [Rhodoferax sp.]MBP9906709.1 hypothetical protein [Rhodoferax sp.]
MIETRKSGLWALMAAAALAAPMALAQDRAAANPPTPKQVGIDELDCRTLLRLGGEERSFTILYLHGYISGKRGQTLLPAQQLAQETDKVIDQCIDRPNDKLLPLFDKIRGN